MRVFECNLAVLKESKNYVGVFSIRRLKLKILCEYAMIKKFLHIFHNLSSYQNDNFDLDFKGLKRQSV